MNALISSYIKDEALLVFAKGLVALGFKILSSGGTAKFLNEHGIPVTDIATIVGPPILGHRVVTLSREVHAALLAKDTLEDQTELAIIGVERIDLVYVTLYPLEAEIAKVDSTPESVIEQTDIGGPTMLRSAAKGRRIVICDPADQTKVLEWLRANRPEEKVFVEGLAAKAEFVVARYALASARYTSHGKYDGVIGTRTQEDLIVEVE